MSTPPAATPPQDPPTPRAAHAARPRNNRRLLLWALLAFGAGLLLFVVLLAGQRDDAGFFRAGQRPAAQDGGFEPLPMPDADTGTADALPAAGERDDGRSVVGSGDAAGASLPDAPDAATLPPPVSPPSAPAPPAAASGPATSARPVRSPPPDYPAQALRRGESGTVLLQVQVDAQGRPERVDVVQSSRSRTLDREAVRTVERWAFAPATRGGLPVASKVLVPIEFNP